MCYMDKEKTKPCETSCFVYEDGLPCPFRTPRKYWEENLCNHCTKHPCGKTEHTVRNRKTGNVTGCFGFEAK